MNPSLITTRVCECQEFCARFGTGRLWLGFAIGFGFAVIIFTALQLYQSKKELEEEESQKENQEASTTTTSSSTNQKEEGSS